MSSLFDQLKRDSLLMAYATTGNEQFLKDMPPMEPLHLPQAVKEVPLEFDVFDDVLMRDCIGGRLTKSVQALLITLSQWDTIPPEEIPAMLKLELMKLRAAVKEEFDDL